MGGGGRKKGRSLFFKSLHRTFGHIAMVDSYVLDVLQDRTRIPSPPTACCTINARRCGRPA